MQQVTHLCREDVRGRREAGAVSGRRVVISSHATVGQSKSRGGDEVGLGRPGLYLLITRLSSTTRGL